MSDFLLRAPEGANKKKRIVGRGQGSGRGTTAGKGNKGQQSRSGGKTYVGFEGGQMPLYRRLAHRGFSNHPFKKSFTILNVCDFENHYKNGDVVDLASLIAKGLVKGSVPVKLLGDGELTKKLTIKLNANSKGFCAVSASAKQKVEKAGGSIDAPAVEA